MRRLLVVLTWIGILGMGMTAGAGETPAKIKVLLLTGDDVAPFHDWRENSEATREALVQTEKFDVKVSEDLMILESNTAIQRYDVIVFTLFATKATPVISDPAKENLLNFVKSGKGFVVTHLASASFPDWEEFGKLCGRKWVMGVSGHSARDVFKAKIADKIHPITQGIEDFQTFDELYSKLQGDSEIQILVTGDSDWSKKTEPLVFMRTYGKGRVFHWAFGHDRKAIMNPSAKKLLMRGCEWAATGKVTE